jgi:thioredoxin-related protein
MKKNWLILTLLLCITPEIFAARQKQEAFANLTFDKALALAGKSKKIVIIDFYTTWCMPCKEMDNVTWKASEVQDWLRQNSVALKIDAEKQLALAKRYKINAYPTILFLKPNGEEIDRIIGFRPPRRFLVMAKDYLAGKDSLAQAKEQIAAKKTDPSARMEYAQTLTQKGLYKEALEEYLWCYDHGLEYSKGFTGVRLSFLLSDIYKLGKTYQPALDALQQRRDSVEKRIGDGSTNFADLMDLVALNRSFKEENRTLLTFDSLKTKGKETEAVRVMMVDLISDQLLAQRRYADIAEGIDLVSKINIAIQIYERLFEKISKEQTTDREAQQQYLTYLKTRTGKDGAKYYEALLGLKRKEEAAKIAERLIAFNPSGSTFVTLIKHAVRVQDEEAVRTLTEKGLKTVKEEERLMIQEASKANSSHEK